MLPVVGPEMARLRSVGTLGHLVLPLLLLSGSLLDWSLISLVNMIVFLAIRYTALERGYGSWKQYSLLWFTVVYSVVVILAQAAFNIAWCIEGEEWNTAHSWWATLIGFARNQPWGPASVIYFLIVQLAAAFVALLELYKDRLHRDSCWLNFSFGLSQIGYHLRVACCLLLPGIQLVVSISQPSWISLPFFVFSCIGLVDWSLTSDFLGLFRCWRLLEMYAVVNIFLLYIYQLPLPYPGVVMTIADFIGLCKYTSTSEWPQVLSGISLLIYYIMLSSAKRDIEEMGCHLPVETDSLTELLLPSRQAFFLRSRSGRGNWNLLSKGSVFRTFSINFFTYGFPVLLLALSFWSFNFTSICALGLLAYVGYILYCFPSLSHLHRLNGSLLVFILLWATSTYIFNVGFAFFNKRFQKDMMIWETLGFWHYSIPGLFLLVQFSLGIFVALCNLVNNSVLHYSTHGGESSSDDAGDTLVLVVATLAWLLRKLSRAITLTFLFLLVMKPGFIHAVYMCFFLVFLVSHTIDKKLRQILIFFCEVHFSILYLLQLDLISNSLEQCGPIAKEILTELGLSNHASTRDFLEIGLIVCLCAVHSNGFEMLMALSETLQNIPYSPVGVGILKAGLNKSVLFSVYNSKDNSRGARDPNTSPETKVASYLSTISEKILSIYHSYGTYVAFLTILMTLYMVRPNYVSFGYLFFLLFWIIGRQLVEQTRRRLWFPLKVYATVVFIFTYSLSISPLFAGWLSQFVYLYADLGFDPKASLLQNVWQSLAVLIVMQLYSYERRQSNERTYAVSYASEPGFIGLSRRLLIWHSEKILSIAVFYAAVSPVSFFGFVYLLSLMICSILPKASRVPSKVILVYTGLLATCEYLFQMWCKHALMCPGQSYNFLPTFLGLKFYDSGFWGVESGLRGKILVTVACIIQYNVFHWLDLMPDSLKLNGKWEEPCQLFLSRNDLTNSMSHAQENNSQKRDNLLPRVQGFNATSSSQLVSSGYPQSPESVSDLGESDGNKRYLLANLWGMPRESHKWNRQRIVALRKDRLEMQMTTFKAYMKFWLENLFKLRGLEMNMIVLLLASFTVLNILSIFYITCLVVFILLKRDLIQKLWPLFVFLFAAVLMLEYVALWKENFPWLRSFTNLEIHCHDCWNSSRSAIDYCSKCWLGWIVDDPRMLVGYYIVFIFSSFKLRSDRSIGFSNTQTYREMKAQKKNTLVWRDLSLETKSFWTFLDYLKLYAYCHLLYIVLALIAFTGTLEYDVLHLGYLGFALVFFRMRLEILKKKNKIFKYLRIYNFVLIVLSLAYQSPYVGEFSSGKCDQIDYLYEVIGLYKYDYGFRITSRSAFVEIVIFLLVSVQSYIFGSSEFENVAIYLQAEQVGAMVSEQNKKAAWKTEQLQLIRDAEERKRQKNDKVEKMKSEVLNLELQLNSMSTISNIKTSQADGLRRRKGKHMQGADVVQLKDDRTDVVKTPDETGIEFLDCFDSPVDRQKNAVGILDSIPEASEIEEIYDSGDPNVDMEGKDREAQKENPLRSTMQFIGDGVSQVQSFGNQAVTNIASFLNIDPENLNSNEHTGEDGVGEIDSQNNFNYVQPTQVNHDKSETGTRSPASVQIFVILQYIWSQMRSNNDYVCYACFVLVFLWNFSLLSMIYLAALFLYALCVNSGPTYLFWVIVLIYTELNILAQYIYQIVIQHCGLNIHMPILQRLGFPEDKIKASFVLSILPLFLVYLTTLIQSSITAKDGEWAPVTEFSSLGRSSLFEEANYTNFRWTEKLRHLFFVIINPIRIVAVSFIRYWESLIQGSESPPYYVQLTMEVSVWPEGGIQPQRIESAVNKVLSVLHEEKCKVKSPNCHSASRVRIQSIEPSKENAHMALAVLEVVYASSPGCHVPEWYKSLTPAGDVKEEILEAKDTGLFDEINFQYQIISVIGGGKREIDLYAYIFGADLAVFFLVATFYQSVIKNKSEFLDVYQLEDQFPKEFVFILMVLFFLIVVDRIIYLWSFAHGKVIFYLFSIVLFTYSVTEYAWNMEPSHKDFGGLILRSIYLTKSISLALQALQIRYGIPNKSTLYRQFLTSKITQVHYLGFRLYRALPFLYELRCVLDWSCTTTSLTMYDWLKLEDIYASLFLVKCDAVLNRAEHKMGQKQSTMTKFCSGICLFFILICVIWTPMLIYSSGNPTNIANPVIDVNVKIDIKAAGGRLNIFTTTACEKIPWKFLEPSSDLDPLDYLATYNIEDIQLICCQPDATVMWLMPPAVQTRFMESLDKPADIFDKMELILTWNLLRARPKGKEPVKYESPVNNCPSVDDIKKVLNGTSNRFRIPDAYPRYFRVTGSGEVRRLDSSADWVSGDLILNNGTTPWWSFYDLNSSAMAGCEDLNGPMAIVVSEETPQGILGETLSKFSIWSLYITFVLAVARFIRLQCADLRMRIPYENLPSCDRLLDICEGIYAARAEGELEVEEVLYWTLVNIYRSPHILLEYTKGD